METKAFSGTREQWDRFAAANGGGILQSHEWGAFRSEPELRWGVQYLRVLDGRVVRLQALVLEKPLPGGASFFYCPEGPVVKNGDWADRQNQRAFETLAKYLQREAAGRRVLFLKIDPHVAAEGFPVGWLTKRGFADSPEDIQAPVVAHVDLSGSEDDILARMKQKGRYNVRYAVKKGVTCRVGADEADLAIFYDLLEQTSKRQGISYRSLRYFELFRKNFMVESDLARFIIAEYQGNPVAAILVTFFGDEAIYLYGGSGPDDRNVFGSYLVQWVGMQEAKRRGCTFYNMTGVAATDDPNDAWAGLRQFKLKFGAEVVQLLGARDYLYKPGLYRAFTTADRLRRGVAKLLGRARLQ